MYKYCLVLFFFFGCNHLNLPKVHKSTQADIKMGAGNVQKNRFIDVLLPDYLAKNWEKDAVAMLDTDNLLAIDSLIWAFNFKGELHLFQANNGKSRGIKSVTSSLQGGVVWYNEHLFIPHAAGKNAISKVDLKTGEVWKVKGENIVSDLLIWQDKLVSADVTGKIQFRNLQTGALIQEQHLVENDAAKPTNKVLASPIAFGDSLFVVDEVGNAGLWVENKWLWQQSLGFPVEETPVYAANGLFISTTRGKVLQLNPKSGEIKTLIDTKNESVRLTSVAVHQNELWVGATDGEVRCVDLLDGKIKFKTYLSSPIVAPLLLTKNKVVVGTMGAKAVLMHRKDGQVAQQIQLRGRVKTAPIFYQNQLVFITEPHHIIAFE